MKCVCRRGAGRGGRQVHVGGGGHGREQIDRNELLPLLAVWKELAQQKETVASISPGSESPRGDALSPLIGGVSLMRPGRSSARIGAPAASEPTAAKSTTCVLL